MKAQNDPESSVREYYDENTQLFLSLGKDAQTRHIHQALYLKPDTTLSEAMEASVRLVYDQIKKMPYPAGTILDLGCGVGSSLFFLLNAFPGMESYGITISETQFQIGNRTITKSSLEDRCQIMRGSFQNLPLQIPLVDFAFAIESFVHSPNALIFFQQVTSKLKKHGRLIIFDDFLSDEKRNISKTDRKWLSTFLEGWQAYSLYRPADLIDLAKSVGFSCIENVDYTTSLRLARPRDYFIDFLVRIFGRMIPNSIYMKFLKGGNARQKCYKRRLLSYRMFCFEKNA